MPSYCTNCGQNVGPRRDPTGDKKVLVAAAAAGLVAAAALVLGLPAFASGAAQPLSAVPAYRWGAAAGLAAAAVVLPAVVYYLTPAVCPICKGREWGGPAPPGPGADERISALEERVAALEGAVAGSYGRLDAPARREGGGGRPPEGPPPGR